MTIQIKDLPENENNTPADRLKAARGNKGITRKKLASLTGIPEKSIEKYEYGGMEPNITRLISLCGALDIKPNEIISFVESSSHNDKNSDQQGTNNETFVTKNEYITDSLEHLEILDDLREEGFENYPRKVYAHFNELKGTLCFLEYDELIKLAENRDIELKISENDLSDEIENETTPNSDCMELVNRIIDTAVFGIDLYLINLEVLSEIAEEKNIAPDRFFSFGWRGHEEIVPKLREKIIKDILTGKMPEGLMSS